MLYHNIDIGKASLLYEFLSVVVDDQPVWMLYYNIDISKASLRYEFLNVFVDHRLV